MVLPLSRASDASGVSLLSRISLVTSLRPDGPKRFVFQNALAAGPAGESAFESNFDPNGKLAGADLGRRGYVDGVEHPRHRIEVTGQRG
jgi:hypothetical protein